MRRTCPTCHLRTTKSVVRPGTRYCSRCDERHPEMSWTLGDQSAHDDPTSRRFAGLETDGATAVVYF